MKNPRSRSKQELSPLVEQAHRVEALDGQRLALVEMRRRGRQPTRARPAFLLIHGFAQNRKAFALGPMPRALLDCGARVFLGELRGHGDSVVEEKHQWTLSTHLDLDCPALLEGVRSRTGVERVHLVGHSMGGLLGCALLQTKAPLASLTAMATPLLLGAGRPLVWLASLLSGPFGTIAPRLHRVPMQHFLGALAAPLAAADARGPIRALQRLTRLVNPEMAEPEALREILANAEPESPAVLEELAKNAVLRQARIADVDMVAAVRQSPLPVVAVVGTKDIFAPRAAVAALERGEHAGPRRVVEIDGVSHVDAIMGHHVPETMRGIFDFLLGREAPPRGRRPASSPGRRRVAPRYSFG